MYGSGLSKSKFCKDKKTKGEIRFVEKLITLGASARARNK